MKATAPSSRRSRSVVLWIRVFAVLLFHAVASSVFAQAIPAEQKTVRFCTVDIYLDSGTAALAAYQVEFSVTNGMGKIVGIEGAEHAAFRNAPHYDPKAIQNERAIMGAFSLLPPASLPSGRTRVATVHLMINGNAAAQYELKVQAAADAQGNKVTAIGTL